MNEIKKKIFEMEITDEHSFLIAMRRIIISYYDSQDLGCEDVSKGMTLLGASIWHDTLRPESYKDFTDILLNVLNDFNINEGQ